MGGQPRHKRYSCIVDEIDKCHPSTILEVGTHRANTAIAMIKAAMQHKDDVYYYGFDLFDFLTEEMAVEEHHGKSFPNLVSAKFKLADYPHILIMGNTRKTLSKFKPDRPIDFVFIDGGHSVETIQSDWDNIKQLMHKDTVVIFDDYYENTDDVGCKSIIDSLGDEYVVEKISEPKKIESKKRDLGKQVLSMIKVSLK
tara:strand:+ start:2460 stop:3053 length:594 start_codon:yes stop_codon:yes gene_type:complete